MVDFRPFALVEIPRAFPLRVLKAVPQGIGTLEIPFGVSKRWSRALKAVPRGVSTLEILPSVLIRWSRTLKAVPQGVDAGAVR